MAPEWFDDRLTGADIDRGPVPGQRARCRDVGAGEAHRGRAAAGPPGPDRHQGELRDAGVRGLHGAGGRQPGQLVRHPGLRPRRHRCAHRRGAGPGPGPASRAGGVHGRQRPAVRLLHARFHHDGRRPAGRLSRRRPGRGAGVDGRQPVPLHRLRAHRDRGHRRRLPHECRDRGRPEDDHGDRRRPQSAPRRRRLGEGHRPGPLRHRRVDPAHGSRCGGPLGAGPRVHHWHRPGRGRSRPRRGRGGHRRRSRRPRPPLRPHHRRPRHPGHRQGPLLRRAGGGGGGRDSPSGRRRCRAGVGRLRRPARPHRRSQCSRLRRAHPRAVLRGAGPGVPRGGPGGLRRQRRPPRRAGLGRHRGRPRRSRHRGRDHHQVPPRLRLRHGDLQRPGRLAARRPCMWCPPPSTR